MRSHSMLSRVSGAAATFICDVPAVVVFERQQNENSGPVDIAAAKIGLGALELD